MTVSWRDRDTPLVVSEFAAQRRFAAEVSSAITTQSSHRAAASARSTVWLRSHAPSCAVLRIRIPRNTAAGQPWLTGATCIGWPLPQVKAPPRT